MRLEELAAQPAVALDELSAFLSLPLDVPDLPAIAAMTADVARSANVRPTGLRASTRRIAAELGYHAGLPVDTDPRSDRIAAAHDDPAAPTAVRATSIPPAPRDRPIEASHAQTRLLFVEEFESGLAVYNLPVALRVTGHLDVPAMKKAFTEVVRRHESLRTGFEVVDGAYLQRIGPPIDVVVPVDDLRALPAVERDVALAERLREEVRRPFDLVAGLKIRGLLLQTADDEHVLVTTLHHIAADGWSG